MSSSAIEVVEKDPKGDHDETAVEMEATNENMDDSGAQEQDSDGVKNEDSDVGDMELPPGSIIFSPQDMQGEMSADSRFRRRPRGRPTLSYDIKSEGISEYIVDDQEFLSCNECGKVVNSYKSLAQHMATHSHFKPFQCPQCPRSFTRKVHLMGHLPLHGAQKQFECPICFQRFSRHDCVKVHMRLHDKSQCSFCNVCQKSFLTIGALRMHMRIHRGEKPFKCHLCGKCFTQKNHLVVHIKRHTKHSNVFTTKSLGPRMFKCEFCEKSFIRLSDYERHIQWNHSSITSGNNTIKKKPESSFKVPYDNVSGLIRQRYRFSVPVAVCTTSTQTDEEGGHVIIPRQYQCQSVTAGTQMSAPPTPRAGDEELYNYIYEDGMDRNYSSDEEEEEEESNMGEGKSEQETVSEKVKEDTENSYEAESASVKDAASTAQDAAFDAMLNQSEPGDTLPDTKSESIQPSEQVSQTVPAKETVSSDTSKDKENPSWLTKEPPASTKSFSNKENFQVGLYSEEPYDDEEEENIPYDTVFEMGVLDGMGREVENHSIDLPDYDIKPPFEEVFTYGNTPYGGRERRGRCGRGRGKPRGSKKVLLFGATELSVIRKSMRSYMGTTVKKEEKEAPSEQVELQEAEKPKECKLAKRQAKKGHDKDFICNQKSCELCNKMPAVSDAESKIEEENSSDKSAPVQIEAENASKKEAVSQEEAKPQKFRSYLRQLGANIINKYLDKQSIPSYPSTINSSVSRYREEYRSYDNNDSLSSRLELESFSVPTYSCKICHRVFRFEGKLHRHIEAVHQNKRIFTPDIKPGRGVLKSVYKPQPMHSLDADSNSEIEALRSEWDDDEDREDGKTGHNDPIKPQVTVSGALQSTYTTINKFKDDKMSMKRYSAFTSQNTSLPVSGSSTVKPLNLCLESKCKLLLKKLFDKHLLLSCGYTVDHISVVLGRILNHFGVKMIEDYGQGQYEVLKYNLWRLIEWKVTPEQMQEFYSAGNSVEEMMDDIMENRVPLVSHNPAVTQQQSIETSVAQEVSQHQVTVDSNHMMVSQVGNVIGGQISLPEGVTQVVLAPDVPPELLQGAQIVTIDPNTGQVISQITADQVIITDALDGDLQQQVISVSQSGVSSEPMVQASTTQIMHCTDQLTTPSHVVLISDGKQLEGQLTGELNQ